MSADDARGGANQAPGEGEGQEELLESLQDLLETPMVFLSLVTAVAFVVEVSVPLSPGAARVLSLVQWVIWVVFVIEFAVKLALAGDKGRFLRVNWLLVLALLLPAFRMARIARAARALRSLGALRVVTLSNRTLRQFEILFARRRVHYVLAVVAAVILLSGAGAYYVEGDASGANIRTFGDGLWFASGIITTVGTELYPVTAEGRVLAFIGMVFGVSAFGYLAGSLASLFVHSDRDGGQGEPAATSRTADALVEEVHSLRDQVAKLARQLEER